MKKILLLSLVFVLAVMNVFAGWEPIITSKKQGDQLKVDSTIFVQDDKWNCIQLNNCSPSFITRSMENAVVLGIDQDYLLCQDSFWIEFDLEIKSWDTLNNLKTSNITLKLNYHPKLGVISDDKSIYKFNGFSKIQTRIIAKRSSLPANAVPPNVFIENIIKNERFYNLNYSTIAVFNNIQTLQTDELLISWSPISGAYEYDLEWLFIDDFKDYNGTTTTYKSQSELNFNFKNNATRITTKTPEFILKNTYEHGYLVFRVRAVNFGGEDFLQRFEGDWSTNDILVSLSSFGTINKEKYFINNGHEPELNWQWSMSFAEEAKNKLVISYFDGTLRSRQMVTQNNSDHFTIVGESVFDHVGRKAIDILPVPAFDSIIKFYPNFNLSITRKQPYSWRDFDSSNNEICNYNLNGMDTISGASRYYSSNNPQKINHQAYLPDAELFPFVQTEFTPDMTGKVRRQGGLGSVHKLGSGHESFFYYGSPTQTELDRLFGVEVGYAKHYKKNLVVDPNGSVSVFYLNPQGNVIATALAGMPPENLNALVQDTGIVNIISNLSEKNSVSISKDQIFSRHSMVVSQTTPIKINYSFKDNSFNTNGCGDAICYDCIYDLKIQIYNDCGVNFLDTFIKNIKPFDTSCVKDTFDFQFESSLPLGVYEVYKELIVNKDSLEKYVEIAVSNNSCLKTVNQIYDSLLLNIDYSGCEITCEECIASLGTRSDFIELEVERSDTIGRDMDSLRFEFGLAYDNQLKECKILCNEDFVCESELVRLKKDVSPGGQYFLYNQDTLGNYFAGDSLSFGSLVPDHPNYSGTFRNWKNINLIYLDDFYDTIYVKLNDSTYLKPNDLSLKEFIENFDPIWANELVKMHPEYCYYQWCVENQEANRFIGKFISQEFYPKAIEDSLLNPVNVSGQPGYNQSISDPLFESVAGSFMKNGFKSNLENYYSIEGEFFSIWDLSSLMHFCPDFKTKQEALNCLSAHPFGSGDIADQTMQWSLLKGFYVSERGKFSDSIRILYANANACSNCYIGNGIDSAYQFSSTCSTVFNNANYLNKAKVYLSNAEFSARSADFSNINQIAEDNKDSIISICENSCLSYVNQWVSQLKYCQNFTQDSAQIIDSLIRVCQLSCDGNSVQGKDKIAFSNRSLTNNYNFSDALKSVWGTNYMDSLCNDDVIHLNVSIDDQIELGFIKADSCGIEWFKSMVQNSGCSSSTIDSMLQLVLNKISEKGLLNSNNALIKLDTVLGVSLYNGYKSILQGYNFINSSQIDYFKSYIDINGDIQFNWISNFSTTYDTCNFIIKKTSAYAYSLDSISSIPVFFNSSFEKSYCLNGKSLEAIGFDNDFNEINLQIIASCYPKCNDSFSINTISDYIFSQTCTYVNPNMIRLGLYALCNNNSDFYVPKEFSCKPLCLTCDLLIEAEQEFESKYNGIFNFNDTLLVNNPTYAEVYENFMNKKFGFFQHFDNYQWLKNNCDSFYQEPVETPEGQAINYFDYPTYLKVVKNCEPFDSAFADSFLNKMVLCDAPIFDIPVNEISCDSSLRIDAYRRAQNIYYNNLEVFKNEFRKNWMEKCLAIDSFEDFKLEYQIKEYHFTLYYYDQAGNLIKTVPPKGVNPITNSTVLNTIKQNRFSKTPANSNNVPSHTYVTRYHYNTLGLLTEQETPDGGLSKFYYDRLGRLVVSQNAKQKNNPKINHQYSYTLYDPLGRIIQVGETSNSDTITDLISRNSNSLLAWFNGADDFEQITSTFYDDTLSLEINDQFGPKGQGNLRGRVAFTQIDYNGDSIPEYLTYFNYNVNGNISEVLHKYNELIPSGCGWFNIAYEYDLISGNVLEVKYQKSKADQFFHQYTYDADNRILSVKTSRDGLFWDEDARYKYYQHGSLSRVEIGQLKVQGLDYAYTIHGWLKGLNSYSLDSSLDIGKDAWVNTNNLNQYVPKDEFGFVLGYYQGDYKDISKFNNQKKFEGHFAGGLNSPNNLYNGNIRYMNVSIDRFMGPNAAPMNYVYRYDQLNRIVSMHATDSFNKASNSWFAQDLKPYYHNRFTYDANGNILTQIRKGTKSGPIDMDSLVYHYQSGNNQLLYVDDNVNSSNYKMDIDDQSSGNYGYDLIGNLVEDNAEEIDTILWNVYGKVKAIYRNEGSQKPNLEFTYGPDGQRLSKRVIKGDTVTTEFYIRDASGNIMARYSQEVNILSVSQIPTDSTLLNATVMVLEDTIDISSMGYEQINALLRNNITLPALQPWSQTMADYYCSSSSFNTFKSQLVSWVQGSGNELSFLYQFSPSVYLPSNSYYFNLTVDNFDYSSFINAMFNDNSSQFIDALWQADAFDLTNSFLWVSKYSFITHIAYNDFALFDAWYTSMGGPPQPTLDDSINFLNGIPNLALTGGLLSQNATDVKNMMITYGVAIASIEYFHSNGNDVRTIIKGTTLPYYSDSQIASILINYNFREVINTIYYNASVINNLTNWLMNNHCNEFVRKFAQTYPVNFDNLQTAYLSSDMSNYKSFLFTTYGVGVISATGQYLYLDVLTPADKVISYYSYTFTPLLQKQKSLTLKEHHIYGSSRLGYQERNTIVHSYDFKAFYSENSYVAVGDTMGYIAGLDSIYTLTRGRKKYEASNHLGNVMVVFTDKRINQCINDSVRYYRADLRSAYDYYPFGMLIPDRTFDSTAYIQLPDRVDTTISQRIKIQIPNLNPGQNITLTKDGETYVLAKYQSGYTGAQYSANIAGSAIVNELSFEDSSGYLIIENTTLGGQKICSGIPSFSLHIAGTNYVVNCSQSIDTIQGGLLSEAGYLFGFNGKEVDKEPKGKGNQIDYGMRIYDVRICKFLSVDPLFRDYAELTPYQFASNNPIMSIDLDGLEAVPANEIWDISHAPVLSLGILSKWYYVARIENTVYEIHQITNGLNKGNYYAKAILGYNKDGYRMYEWRYVIGGDRINEYTGKNNIRSSIDVGGRKYTAYSNAIILGAFKYVDYVNPNLRSFNYGNFLGDAWTSPEIIVSTFTVHVPLVGNRTGISKNASKGVVNSKGIAYPKVVVEGFGEVPFPKGPFTPNNSQVLRSQFTPKLKADFKDWWIQQGRPWPNVPEGSTLNIHHIKPLGHGGTNSFDNLVPLIQPQQHQPFTNWWRGF